MASRRGFLKAGGLALFSVGVGGMGGVPSFLARAAESEKQLGLYKKAKVLVCIFQRGAMDGLMAVTPFTDEYLKAARPSLFLSAAKASTVAMGSGGTGGAAAGTGRTAGTAGAGLSGGGGAAGGGASNAGGSSGAGGPSLIDLDGRWGLHPAMSAFEPLFREKRLAIVHGIGSPNNSRSHFDAQDYMESGTPFDRGTPSGWLNRATGMLGPDAGPFRAVSLTSSLPRSLYGDNPALAIGNLQDFAIQLRGNPLAANLAAKSFEELYDQTSSALLNKTGKESFEAMKLLQGDAVRHYQPANNAVYPNSPLGGSLKQIAQLIKMDLGLELAFTECGGWDTHFNQGAGTGIFARNVQDLSGTIAAFWTDLGAWQDQVTVMTMTEFGRTVRQNGTGGTDHGRASCNFILGNDVNGGLVHGKIEPLAPENLEEGRDLAVTTDFRSVFSEVADRHLQIANDSVLFPGWKGARIGVMRS